MKVYRAALWILGEYARTASDIESVIKQFRRVLGDGPLLEAEQKLVAGEASAENGGNEQPSAQSSTLVTSDGTYATQSAFNTVQVSKKDQRPPLRQYLMDGDFFIAAAVGTTVTKLALRYGDLVGGNKRNHFDADVMLLMAGIIHLGKSGM